MDYKNFKEKITTATTNQMTFNAEMQKLKDELFEEIKDGLIVDDELSVIDNVIKNKKALKANFLCVRLADAKKFAKKEITIQELKTIARFDILTR